MENETYRERLAQEAIFVTAEDHCYEVSSIGATTKEELRSTQEESDTRVLLYAAYAAKAGYRAVVITSKIQTYLFSLWLSKASSRALCLSNEVNRIEQNTSICR